MDQSIKPRAHGRNHQLDLLRIGFATLILLAHAPSMVDGDQRREIFARITHSDLTFGTIGLDGFFLLSGFLIVQSWQNDPELLNFLAKRILRIVPGYVVAVLLSVAIVGLVAPGVPHFFHHLTWWLPFSMLQLTFPATPAVFPNQHFPLANGSLWTIHYEFFCYLVVALFGVAQLLRRAHFWAAANLLALVIFITPQLQAHLTWKHLLWVFGTPSDLWRFLAIYFTGGSYYLLRRYIPFRPVLAVIAAVALCTFGYFHLVFEAAIIVFGGYLLFYLGHLHLPSLSWMSRVPDVSYGIYLYGWPVEMLLIWFFHPSPWIVFAAATLLCFPIGWLSWHFVERPMLKLKRRATAPLPAA